MHNIQNGRTVFNLNKMGIPRCFQFGHYQYTHVKPGLENHIHKNTLEICYFLSGRQIYKIGQDFHELRGNDIIVIAPNLNHGTGAFPEDKGELYWIQVSLENKKGMLCHLPNSQSDFLLNGLLKNPNQIFRGAYKLKPILNKLEKELKKQKNPMSALIVNQLLIQLLLETLRISQIKLPNVPEKKLEAIEYFVLHNMDKVIYVDELATVVNLSVPYFKAWFKEQKGMPPKEYTNRLKIDRAKLDLLTKQSITQVAFDLGFGSSQYFTTVFKKFTGVTPKWYIASRTDLPPSEIG